MTEIKCIKCERCLGKKVVVVKAEIQCPKCGYKNNIDIDLRSVIIEDEDPPKRGFVVVDS